MGIFDKLIKNKKLAKIHEEIIMSAYTTCFDIINSFGLIDTKIYFDNNFFYINEKQIKNQIQYITMDKLSNINVSINDKCIDLLDCNIMICTLIEFKMKKYEQDFFLIKNNKI